MNTDDIRQRIEELTRELHQHNYNYYVLDKPTVSDYDFDMMVATFPQSESPGNEQREYWGSSAADIPGTRNLAGLKNAVVDELIERVIAASSREDLIYATRALDRVLLWQHIVIPQWHIAKFRVAYWNKFSRPDIIPRYSLGLDTWWIDAEKNAELVEYRKKLKK